MLLIGTLEFNAAYAREKTADRNIEKTEQEGILRRPPKERARKFARLDDALAYLAAREEPQ